MLEETWKELPDQRFFQFLFNYTRLGTRAQIGSINDPFYYEDDELEEMLKVLKEMKDENKD